MRSSNTVRAKKPKDRASVIMINIGFARMVADELRDNFKVELVRAERGIGTTGHEKDWPMTLGGDAEWFWHINTPCFDKSHIPATGSVGPLDYDRLEDNPGRHDYRQMAVPPSVSLRVRKGEHSGGTLICLRGSHAGSSIGSERLAMDQKSAIDAARWLVEEQSNMIATWLYHRTDARKLIDKERERRALLGKRGQGGNWFVQQGGDGHFSILNGREIDRNGCIELAKPGIMEIYSVDRDTVFALHKALKIPDKWDTLNKDTLNTDTYRFEHGKWLMGYPANQWAVNKEVELELAHRTMKTDPPVVPTVPRRFRTLRKEFISQRDGEDVHLSALVAEEATRPFQELMPKTIVGLDDAFGEGTEY